jgi:hypothetical protein
MTNDNEIKKESKDENYIWQEKAKYYKERNQKVHIETKYGKYHNGTITEIRADFLMMDEVKSGLIPIFYLEMVLIEPYINPTFKTAKDYLPSKEGKDGSNQT